MNRDWVDKDFYQVLGVPSAATAEEIKRAYRKLAQKHHPDANPDDPKAEDRFKEITEAYATLSNEEQRQEYDQVRKMVDSGGFAGFPGGSGGYGGQRIRVEDLNDLLGGFGGGLFDRGNRRGGARRGTDLAAELTLSFEDAVKGVTTTVSVRGDAVCSRCGGSGAEPGTPVEVCPTCGGSGSIARNQGLFSFSEPCPQCRGRGRLIPNPCTQCRGRGTEVRSRNLKVKIPAGVGDGSTIRLAGKGGPGRDGGPAGDLLVTVNVQAHPVFGRRGRDLTLNVPITFAEAALGTRVELPTLDGPVTVKIPAGTQSGRTFRVRGKGVQPDRGRAGDLLAKVEVVIPKKLSRDEKKLIEELAGLDVESPRSHLGTTP
jgi:molecular chaperone DnaJ